MRPFILDSTGEKELARIRKYAEENVYSMDDLLDMHNKKKPVPGDLDEHTSVLPVGFRIVYSVEKQRNVNVRHISMSLLNEPNPDNLPHPEAIKLIMPLLGFEKPLEQMTEVKITKYVEGSVIEFWEIF